MMAGTLAAASKLVPVSFYPIKIIVEIQDLRISVWRAETASLGDPRIRVGEDVASLDCVPCLV